MALLEVTTASLHPHFGYAVLATLFTVLVHVVYMPLQIGKARKRYRVPYPNLYAPFDNKDHNIFNCIQRGHQNSLEMLPPVLALTILVGLKYPLVAAFAQVDFAVGRILYFKGYATGVPKNRLRGSLFYVSAVLILIVASAVTGISLILK